MLMLTNCELQVYFGEGCLRTPASTCLNSSNPYYPTTNHGLNLLTYFFLDRAVLMVDDSDASLTTSNTRYQFIWAVRQLSLLGDHPHVRRA